MRAARRDAWISIRASRPSTSAVGRELAPPAGGRAVAPPGTGSAGRGRRPRGGIALIEDEVDDLQHRGNRAARSARRGVSKSIRPFAIAFLHADDALGDRRLARQEARAHLVRSPDRRPRCSVSASAASAESKGSQAVKMRHHAVRRSHEVHRPLRSIDRLDRFGPGRRNVAVQLPAISSCLRSRTLSRRRASMGPTSGGGHQPGAGIGRERRSWAIRKWRRRARPAPVPRHGRHRA